MNMSEEMNVFVYEDVAVVLTGRTAGRSLRSQKIDTLLEITPQDQEQGSWKKWVREVELFTINR